MKLKKPNKQAASGGDRLKDAEAALVHVGKTGGTSLRTLLQELRDDGTAIPLIKLRHQTTVSQALEENPALKLGFVYRDPAARFVSGFYSRLRNGRPAYNSLWTPAEAAAFSWFSDANSLAEALFAEDPRLQSAAHFAMANIRHLARGYAFYFQSPDYFSSIRSRIYCMCELEDLNSRAPEFFTPFGVSEQDVQARLTHSHRSGSKPDPLSDLARDNLRRFWHMEYKLYDCFRSADTGRGQG